MKKMLCILAVVALLGAACGGDDDDASANGDSGGGGSSGALTASDFAFSPTSLSVAAGDSFEFTNDDEVEHNFSIDDADIDEDAEAGESTTVDVSSLEAGTYDFYCKYHKDQMTGTLEITG
jgi:plastocyanin